MDPLLHYRRISSIENIEANGGKMRTLLPLSNKYTNKMASSRYETQAKINLNQMLRVYSQSA